MNPQNIQRKLHTKLFYQIINNCMQKIEMEDIFEVFLLSLLKK